MRWATRAWKGIKSVGQAITLIRAKDGTETSDVRQYINSIAPKVNLFADAVRGHGGIESLHWILDVVFNEDASRLRNGESTQNFGFLRKFVVSLLKRDTSKPTWPSSLGAVLSDLRSSTQCDIEIGQLARSSSPAKEIC